MYLGYENVSQENGDIENQNLKQDDPENFVAQQFQALKLQKDEEKTVYFQKAD